MLNKPPQVLLNALAALQAEHIMTVSKFPSYLEAMWTANPLMRVPKNRELGSIHQGFKNDRLFVTTYEHRKSCACDNCDPSEEVKRDKRDTADPEIHYVIIASGNMVIEDASIRDTIADSDGIACMCVEMEASGLMDQFPCLVMRGI